jgi:hypothetical protein
MESVWVDDRTRGVTLRALTPWVVLLVAAVSYPVAILASGSPRFPTRSECVHLAKADGDLEVVFGRSSSPVDASALLERVLHVGFQGSQVEPDGCGLFKVAVHGIPTLKVGNEVVAEAHSVGLRATVEVVG